MRELCAAMKLGILSFGTAKKESRTQRWTTRATVNNFFRNQSYRERVLGTPGPCVLLDRRPRPSADSRFAGTTAKQKKTPRTSRKRLQRIWRMKVDDSSFAERSR